MNACKVCGKQESSLLRCSACKAVWYCGKDHQRADWTTHKIICAKQQSNVGTKDNTKEDTNTKENKLKNKLASSGIKFSYRSNKNDNDDNILILLHGLGDSEDNYMKLFDKMELPNTAGLGIRGFSPLPLDMGYGWFPSFNPTTVLSFAPERLAGLKQTRKKLLELLKTVFTLWDPVKVFLLGFSQGAVAAVDAAIHCEYTLGGVIGISSTTIDEVIAEWKTTPPVVNANNITPLFISHGSRDSTITLDKAKQQFEQLKQNYGHHPVEWHQYSKGHSMIQSQDEMKDLMTFFSRHLSSKGPSQQTLANMSKNGELLEVKGVTPSGDLILE